MENLYSLGAAAAAKAIREGEITSVELVEACFARIDEFEPTIQAWAHLDKENALNQAEIADKRHYDGEAEGPLNGVPVGIKDIFDTEDFPTEYGSLIHEGRRTFNDASAVAQLRQAGAIVLGKTVTTEFAVYAPGKTTNPHDASRTPGGSSSGSAAAVASFMVPLAVGSQTNGSTIRPASFCGVVGYKPSFGTISRHGVLRQSPPLDQVGVFARSVEDAAIMAECMMAFDDADRHMRPRARPHLSKIAMSEPPMPPKVGFLKTPAWDQADTEIQEAFAELADVLGDRCAEVEIAEAYDEVAELHRVIMEADLAKNFAYDFARAPEQFSAKLTEMIERGRKVTAVEYNIAIERQHELERGLDQLMSEYDAILTPAAPGEAPVGLDATGSPAFCTMWTYLGMPAITLPVMQGGSGMPLGVQLVGKKFDDARLLRTATWLDVYIETSDAEAA